MNLSSRPTTLALFLVLLGTTPMLTSAATAGANQPARVVASVTPTAPYLMHHAGATAEVTVLFTVSSQGTVTRASIVDSNNFEFNAPTLDAIKRWTFAPAIKNGQAVETRLRQTFTFVIRDQTTLSDTTPRIAGK